LDHEVFAPVAWHGSAAGAVTGGLFGSETEIRAVVSAFAHSVPLRNILKENGIEPAPERDTHHLSTDVSGKYFWAVFADGVGAALFDFGDIASQSPLEPSHATIGKVGERGSGGRI
jgi:hypothetical protein